MEQFEALAQDYERAARALSVMAELLRGGMRDDVVYSLLELHHDAVSSIRLLLTGMEGKHEVVDFVAAVRDYVSSTRAGFKPSPGDVAEVLFGAVQAGVLSRTEVNAGFEKFFRDESAA
jgi:hypothetical protein